MPLQNTPTYQFRERDNMSHSPLHINGQPMEISVYISNSLTEEACKEANLDSVDMDIIHTDLKALNSDIVSSETHGVIYYMPQKINVQEPLISSIGARLVTRRASESTDIEGIYVEIIRYDGQRYHLVEPSGNGIPNRFALPGLLGCTATINLGFLLLKELQATTTTQLGVLILFDQERLNELVETDIEVDDDYIIGYSLT